jgi:FlaA1/EpsC-like NDP-sugar epimerase
MPQHVVVTRPEIIDWRGSFVYRLLVENCVEAILNEKGLLGQRFSHGFGRSLSALRSRARGVARELYLRRQGLALVSTVLVTIAAYAAAYAVRFEMRWPAEYTRTFLATLSLLVALRIAVSFVFNLNVHRWRYSGIRDLADIVLATLVSSGAFYLVVLRLGLDPAVPRSVVLLECVFASYTLGGLRLGYRLAFEWYQRRLTTSGRVGDRRRVLIVGAGEAASFVSHHMIRYPESGYVAVGFVDDDRRKARTRMWGLPVLGRLDDIPRLVETHAIREIVVAMPSAAPAAIRRVVNICEDVDVRLTILPHERSVLQGPVRLSQLRDVQIEDLLAREPIQLELPELAADIEAESVLITGAAGSIGSELARQVALHRPTRLVLFDQAETDLFFLDMELRERHSDLEIVALVGDIRNGTRVEQVFKRYRPTRVYHAAAYKHVPMMEENPSEAVRNNVVGTWQVAAAAGNSGTRKFVLISTDKAVNPTSVMGTTKRAAELVVLSCAEVYPETAFTAVRFGNVMGSQGRVIPIFKKQLAEGKKLTVTHPEVTRFFMTIPEAVQLVLQASLLREARSHITMLDMGQPVRVLDMARHLLRLGGEIHPDERIEIMGLRPGEKLHEELTFDHEATRRTVHPKVQVVERGSDEWKLELHGRLRGLIGSAALDGDGECLERILEMSRRTEEESPLISRLGRYRSERIG